MQATVLHTVVAQAAALKNRATWLRPQLPHLSLTEQQGSMISSFPAILALQPLVTLFKYTMGVLPADNNGRLFP